MVPTVRARDAEEHHFSFWSSSTTDVDHLPWANTPYAMDRRETPELELGEGSGRAITTFFKTAVRHGQHYFKKVRSPRVAAVCFFPPW